MRIRREPLLKYSSHERSDDDPPPAKWSDLRYVFDIKEDCNGKEGLAISDSFVLLADEVIE